MSKKITVGMGSFKVAQEDYILESLGIGSCVCICLYDSKNKIGGLAHIMLPKKKKQFAVNPLRFVEEAVDAMVKRMVSLGAKKETLVAKIIGGATIFTTKNSVGDQNVVSVKKKLKKENIPLVKQDVGGNQGRNIWFDLNDGMVVVGHIHGGTEEI